MLEVEVHCVVAQLLLPITALAVVSKLKNWSPRTKSDIPPVWGAFGKTWEATGPSKVKAFVLVPIPAPTVSIAALRAVSAVEPPVQTRDEADVQELVRQKMSLVEALTVKS
jgi:hypothetical protein